LQTTEQSEDGERKNSGDPTDLGSVAGRDVLARSAAIQIDGQKSSQQKGSENGQDRNRGEQEKEQQRIERTDKGDAHGDAIVEADLDREFGTNLRFQHRRRRLSLRHHCIVIELRFSALMAEPRIQGKLRTARTILSHVTSFSRCVERDASAILGSIRR